MANSSCVLWNFLGGVFLPIFDLWLVESMDMKPVVQRTNCTEFSTYHLIYLFVMPIVLGFFCLFVCLFCLCSLTRLKALPEQEFLSVLFFNVSPKTKLVTDMD